MVSLTTIASVQLVATINGLAGSSLAGTKLSIRPARRSPVRRDLRSSGGAVVAKYGEKSIYFDLDDLPNTTGQWDLYGSDGASPYNPLQVTEMKAEYIPPREDVIMQNEAPDDVYVVVSGEVEIINSKAEKEHVIGTLGTGDMFGEVSALCDRPQSFTFRTRTLSQLLRLKQSTLREAMQAKQEDSIVIIKNFLKHQVEFKSFSIEELLGQNREYDQVNVSCNLLTMAATGNSCFLEELLKAGMDPNIGDSRGRTPLVPPAELEALLISHLSIVDAAVVLQKDEVAGEVPVAFVVGSKDLSLTEEAVKEFIAKQSNPAPEQDIVSSPK